MDIGPIELVVMTFPGERADQSVASALVEVVELGYVTVLDLVFLSRTTDGQIRMTDVDEDLAGIGFASLQVEAQVLISEDDLDFIRDYLEPGTSAALVVYEQTWARKLSGVVAEAGGQMALHLQLPRETVEAAFAAASLSD